MITVMVENGGFLTSTFFIVGVYFLLLYLWIGIHNFFLVSFSIYLLGFYYKEAFPHWLLILTSFNRWPIHYYPWLLMITLSHFLPEVAFWAGSWKLLSISLFFWATRCSRLILTFPIIRLSLRRPHSSSWGSVFGKKLLHWEGPSITAMAFLPKMHILNQIMRKHQTN